MNTYDLIIIGGGPAGAAAAVYAARKQLKSLIITPDFGGQSVVSSEIYNWIGTKAISGADLAKSMESHVREYEGEFLDVKDGSKVTSLEKRGDDFMITTDKTENYVGKTILIVSGSGRRKLDIPGADKFENKGVVYCASCDGPLFSGMDVAVVGGGNAGFETAAQLAAYCKSVTLIHRGPEYKADQITVEKVLAKDNVAGMLDTSPTEVLGDKLVSGVKYKNGATGDEGELSVGGVFVEIGQIPNTDFVGDTVEMDDFNRIKIDPRTQRSSLPGIWAAGDVADVLYHQNNIAAGDGVKAVEDIYLYLHAR